MKKELHLIILWERARYKEKEILADIKKHLRIIECYDILWNPRNVAGNFTRFYGIHLPVHSAKEKECGTGSFLLLTVFDDKPRYDFVETSRGYEYVNTNIFSLKQKYRKWTGGGHKIHATNTPAETNHDLTLLLGKNCKDYLKQATECWNGRYRKLNQDLIGCNGWKNLKELFYCLNNTVNYVVLRNHQYLPQQFNSKEHGDIDILVNDFQNAVLILNATKVFNIPYRVHYSNIVNNQKVLWDIRYLGDNYYCENWQKHMLSDRILNNSNIYIQSPENYFYSLVYHTLIHKRAIAADYYTATYNLFKCLYPDSQINLNNYCNPFDAYYVLLKKFMFKHRYYFIRPDDKSVYYNESVINTDKIIEYLEQNYFLSHVEPVMINCCGGGGYIYFQGYENNHRLFIKWGGIGDSCKNEFIYARHFYELNSLNFVKPRFYKYDGDKKFVAMDWQDGNSLEIMLAKNLLTLTDKDNIIRQLKNIAQTLLTAKCVHRDIRPANLIFTDNRQLKLIDSQFAVDFLNYRECSVIKNNPQIIKSLGCNYALGEYKWDDLYSIAKVIEKIGISPQTQKILDEIKSDIGKLQITFPKSCNSQSHNIFIKQCLRLISCFIPIRSWRKKLRSLHA